MLNLMTDDEQSFRST